MDENELYHHGIKGMKWGVRRTDAQLGHKTASSGSSTKKKITSGGKKASAIASKTLSSLKDKIEAGKKARAAAAAKKEAEAQKKAEESAKKIDPKKPVKQMTDTELREKINRLRMEKEYKDLLNSTRNEKVKKGSEFASTILKDSGKEILTQVAKHYEAELANQIINKRDASGALMQVIFANNKKKS